MRWEGPKWPRVRRSEPPHSKHGCSSGWRSHRTCLLASAGQSRDGLVPSGGHRLSNHSAPRSRHLVHIQSKPVPFLLVSRLRLSPHPAGLREEPDGHYVQLSDPWPDLELFKKLPFDYIIHDPKYEDASLICSHHPSVKSEGQTCNVFQSTWGRPLPGISPILLVVDVRMQRGELISSAQRRGRWLPGWRRGLPRKEG